jgi:DUF1365 family protein
VVTAIYSATVAHERTTPLHHAFTYRMPMWLVDLDALPAAPRGLGFLVRFDAADHFGGTGRSMRDDLERVLAREHLPPPARVDVLSNPRSFGHGFNPLSMYWCRDASEAVYAVVAEVHNTYGEHHCYVLRPDANGRDVVDKELYVSPFFAVDGSYEVSCRPPGDELDVRLALRRGGEVVFGASLTARAPVPVTRVVGAALRHPFTGWWVSARIRWQGVRLWARRVPVVSRPAVPRPIDSHTNRPASELQETH